VRGVRFSHHRHHALVHVNFRSKFARSNQVYDPFFRSFGVQVQLLGQFFDFDCFLNSAVRFEDVHSRVFVELVDEFRKEKIVSHHRFAVF
jgi:hypothetical protein